MSHNEPKELRSSEPTTTVSASLPQDDWWIKVPTDPALSFKAKILDDNLSDEEGSRQKVFRPLGRSTPVIVTDEHGGGEMSITLLTEGREEYEALVHLWESQRTLLLQTTVGVQWYLYPGRIETKLMRTKNVSTNPVRKVKLDFIEVERP